MVEHYNLLNVHQSKDSELDIDNKELLDAFLKLKVQTPNRKKTKANGEVFTPEKLINEMLDKLPKDVWTNSELKWFDPAVGTGQFMVIVYRRLMKGLQNDILDEAERKNHIIKNMLFMSELDEQNYTECEKIFGNDCNIFKGNTLESSNEQFKFAQQFGISKFDVIVGNPPYNARGTINTGNAIWHKFVSNSIEWLHENGYLVFVHPSGWRQPESKLSKYKGLFKLMVKDNTMEYLEIHDQKDGMNVFKAGTRYDWYVLKKSQNKGFKTTVIDEDGHLNTIDLSNWPWLPNKYFDQIHTLIGTGCPILYDRTKYGSDKKDRVHHTKTSEFKYPLIHSTPKKGAKNKYKHNDTKNDKEEDKTRFMYSNRNDLGFFGVSKVIFGDSGFKTTIVDIDGRYGMTEHAMAIQVTDSVEAKLVKEALESQRFQKLLQGCIWGNYQINWRLFASFKKDWYKEIVTNT